MRRSSAMVLLAALAAWLFHPLAVAGQIDHRVNRGDAGGSGRLLDQNLGLGTSGVNPVAPTFDGWQRSNALISNNLTGLGRFQAYSPVLSNNQFRVSLPSAGLSGFHAISVGVDDVRANRTLRPSYYFGVQETVPDVWHIQRGLNAPGSSTLRTPYAPPPAVAAPKPTGVFPALPDALDLRVDNDPDPSNFGVIQQTQIFETSAVGDLLGRRASPFQAAVESSLFGIPPRRDLATARLLLPGVTAEGAEARPGGSELEIGPLEAAAARATAGAVGVTEQGVVKRFEEPIGPVEIDTGLASPGLPASVGDSGGMQASLAATGSQAQPEVGLDRFTDFYRVVELAEQRGIRLSPDLPGDESVGSAGGDSTRSAREAEERQAMERADVPAETSLDRDRGVRELATAVQWAGELLENPITTFAGRFRNRMNQYMEAGEAALRRGEYYNAARQFDLAHTVDPNNPLPLLHRGHALVAAGDYASASLSLQQGIERFPQIAAFRIDLPAIAGQRAVFDIRRADLESQLAVREYYEFRFLLGYLELYSALPEAGLRDLERAAAEAPEGSVISLFVDLLLGRREFPQVHSGE
ncbi:MAG: hypothetical protein ABII12_07265 [Planctomycetota bacterium]